MDKRGKCLFVLFALAYSWRTIVFHVFLLPHSSKKMFWAPQFIVPIVPTYSVISILGPHQFSHRQFVVLTFPQIFRDLSDSLIHCSLAVALYCTPRKYPQSLSYGFNMHRVRRRAPDRVFQISSIGAKARALAMLVSASTWVVRICFRTQTKTHFLSGFFWMSSVLGFGDFRSTFSIFLRRSL